jgi:FkbM family methyltransferase
MTNYLVSAVKYLRFRMKYPSVSFVRPLKSVGTFFSQDGQDLYVSSLIVPLYNKIESRMVIDVGANDPQKFSNSLFFEKYLGCETIAVDPLREFQEQWDSTRHRAKFYNLALGSKEGELVLNVPAHHDNMFSTLDGGHRKENVKSVPHERRPVKVTTLTKLLKSNDVTDVLFMSIDVEGSELDVLRGIDFECLKFMCVLIENNSDGYFGDDAIRDYMMERGYIYYARLGWLDDLFLHPSLHMMLNRDSE